MSNDEVIQRIANQRRIAAEDTLRERQASLDAATHLREAAQQTFEANAAQNMELIQQFVAWAKRVHLMGSTRGWIIGTRETIASGTHDSYYTVTHALMVKRNGKVYERGSWSRKNPGDYSITTIREHIAAHVAASGHPWP
ncbi:MAG: hypothetical protein QG658_628 [Patescibacteria group bacterium]|jgi:hypothetical protein|nr:hypothetical protein [Patescibacteria group bacterium]